MIYGYIISFFPIQVFYGLQNEHSLKTKFKWLFFRFAKYYKQLQIARIKINENNNSNNTSKVPVHQTLKKERL